MSGIANIHLSSRHKHNTMIMAYWDVSDLLPACSPKPIFSLSPAHRSTNSFLNWPHCVLHPGCQHSAAAPWTCHLQPARPGSPLGAGFPGPTGSGGWGFPSPRQHFVPVSVRTLCCCNTLFKCLSHQIVHLTAAGNIIPFVSASTAPAMVPRDILINN